MRLPGLHSIHWKVFAMQLVVLVVPLTYVAYRVRFGLETSYLQSTEEGMIDTGAVVAELYVHLYREFGADPARLAVEFKSTYSDLNESNQIKAHLFGYTRDEIDTRLLIFDRAGHVLFDSGGAAASGGDYSNWRDVRHALQGRYGSRWELDRAHRQVQLYSTLPVFEQGRVIGAVSISKSTNRIRNFIARAFQSLLLPGAIAFLLAAATAYLLSAYITRIIWDLASRAQRIAAGERSIRLETWSRSELGTLARAVEQMREKLEGKAYVEEMVTNLSHELKTPLASIRGSAELLEDGAIADPPARARFLTNIQSEVQRLDRIVTELLKLSRIETQAPDSAAAPVDLVPLAREIAAQSGVRMAEGGIRFATEIASEPLRVAAPELELRQLLTNLLDNAMLFTPAGRAASLTLTRQGNAARLVVRDEGQGIEPELLPKIFDRFFTTENPRTGHRGTGLGLAIVRSVVTIHHGEISVQSRPGEGSTFTVLLPLAR